MQPQRIFVRAPNWVGDLVMATSAFARIRAAYPDAEITCGLRPYLRTLLDGTDHFDSFLDMPKAGGLRGLLRQSAELRRRRFDLAIVCPNSPESGLVPFLAGVPRRLGYRQGRPFLMNLGLRAEKGRPFGSRHGPRRVPVPMPEYYRALLDVIDLPPLDLHPRLVVTDDEQRECDEWFAERGIDRSQPIVAFNAGASYGGSKLWEADRFAAAARYFRERHGMTPVFLAGPSDADMVRDIAAAAGAVAAVDPVLPVRTLKPMIKSASLLITLDSGPRHIGVAFDVPTVCLIGPNDRRYTDYCLERQIIIQKDLECVPCQRKVCPLGHRRCMTTIETDEVVRAGEQLLESFGRAAPVG